jgi:hypothetical protein
MSEIDRVKEAAEAIKTKLAAAPQADQRKAALESVDRVVAYVISQLESDQSTAYTLKQKVNTITLSQGCPLNGMDFYAAAALREYIK